MNFYNYFDDEYDNVFLKYCPLDPMKNNKCLPKQTNTVQNFLGSDIPNPIQNDTIKVSI